MKHRMPRTTVEETVSKQLVCEPCERPPGMKYLPGCDCGTCSARRAVGQEVEIIEEPVN